VRWQCFVALFVALPWTTLAATAEITAARRAEEHALLARHTIDKTNLKALRINTPLVTAGRASAVICPADAPACKAAAEALRDAIKQATGVESPVKSADQLTADEFESTNAILLGHLDNHRWIARLYHQFFVCLDVGFTGRNGYELRSVHDPFGKGHNYIVCGGSAAEGTALAAKRLAALIEQAGRPGNLELGRLLEVVFDANDSREPPHSPLSDKQRDALVANGKRLFTSAGQARSAVSSLVECGVAFHRTGDRAQGEAFRGMLHALLDYYKNDAYINGDGMGRYDADFRDSWTYEVAVLWDLTEESGLFSDDERLEFTNLVARLALECTVYQGWSSETAKRVWAKRNEIAHNHLTFPALGLLFAGHYFQRHYQAAWADDWLKIAHGVFRGQRRCAKPQEDAACYQWLVVIHTMIYSLAEDDRTFFDEGHARQTARLALTVLDNAGYQAAFGDHDSLKAAAGVAAPLQIAGWYYRDAGFVWGAALAGRDHWFPLRQLYTCAVQPTAPTDHVGASVVPLPEPNYKFTAVQSVNAVKPNLPWSETFDKLALRAGWQRDSEYLLLDGFGRGNHMHFDANAIVSFAAGGEPLLVDGEYIKNGPKYHNSLLILRDGVAADPPAVAGLGRADYLASAGYTRTWLADYSGADWTRAMLWRPGNYLLVSDEVAARVPGDFTLRCCWRPWGEARLTGRSLSVTHAPMRLSLENADASQLRYHTRRVFDRLPIGCLAEQVNRTLQPGQHYRFVNLVHADPTSSPRRLLVRQVADGAAVVEYPGGVDVVLFRGAASNFSDVQSDAELLAFSRTSLLAAGCTSLAISGQTILATDQPVACEWGITGEAVINCTKPTHLRVATATGNVDVSVPAGRSRWQCQSPFANALARLIAKAIALPAWQSSSDIGEAAAAREIAPRWQFDRIARTPEPLKIVSVASSVPPREKPGPLANLIDRRFAGSVDSVMWLPGAKPVITAELPAPIHIEQVVLREWQFGAGNDIGQRLVELSNDGFKADVRRVPGEFRKAGTGRSGTNVHTLMAIDVGQSARQVRISLAPATAKAAIYLAEFELRGIPEDSPTELTALAAGHITGKQSCAIAATRGGTIQAVLAGGKELWRYDSPRHDAIRGLACIDVDGDGSDEIAFGDAAGYLGLLDGQGKLRWESELPRYRGLTSDVRTIFPAHLRDRNRADIVCGAASWQYFAFDVGGRMLWKHVIYAHAATVGCAADFTGDGRQSVIAGNTYYTLNAIASDGKRLWRSSNIGPEMTAVAATDLDGDGQREALTGVDSGYLHAFDRKGKALWKVNLGDRITAILPAQGPSKVCLLVAAESANLFALDGAGRIVWRCALPDSAKAAVANPRTNDPIAVAADSAGVVLVNQQGKIVGRGSVPGNATSLVLLDDCVVAATDRDTLMAFPLRPTAQ